MSIEKIIQDNTAAMRELTAALLGAAIKPAVVDAAQTELDTPAEPKEVKKTTRKPKESPAVTKGVESPEEAAGVSGATTDVEPEEEQINCGAEYSEEDVRAIATYIVKVKKNKQAVATVLKKYDAQNLTALVKNHPADEVVADLEMAASVSAADIL